MLYQISSGQGPAECELGVAKFLAYLQRRHQVTVEELSAGYHAETYRSVRLRSDEDLQAYVGSIQCSGKAPAPRDGPSSVAVPVICPLLTGLPV